MSGFSGKLGVKKWLILLNPVCGLIVGIVLGAVLPGNLRGIAIGMRNLGEGLMYLIPYAYYQKKASPVSDAGNDLFLDKR